MDVGKGCKQQAPTALDWCIRQLPAGCDRKITGLQLYPCTTQSELSKIYPKNSASSFSWEFLVTADAENTGSETLICKDIELQHIVSMRTAIVPVWWDFETKINWNEKTSPFCLQMCKISSLIIVTSDVNNNVIPGSMQCHRGAAGARLIHMDRVP